MNLAMPESAPLPSTAQSFVEQFGALSDQLPGADLPWLKELREDGIARSGGKELAQELERTGYAAVAEAAA